MSHHTLITMTCGVSIDLWKKTGLLSRELGYYASLSKKTGDLSFLTYDGRVDNEQKLIEPYLPKSTVFAGLASHLVPYRFGAVLSSFFSCFLPLGKFKTVGLIRSNQFYGSWSGLILAKRLKVPFILRCGYVYSQHYEKGHSKHLVRVWLVKKLEKYVANSSDAIIVTYENAKKYFIEEHAVHPDRITVLGNPIDTDLFHPISEVEKTGDVISIGRLEDQKNYFALIEACKNAGLKLTLLGKGSLKEKLENFAKEIQAQVDFLPPVPNEEIPLILAKHKIFVLPSFYEGNPKSLLEALSSGIPCIASDISENRLIIENGTHGLLCTTDSKSISESLIKLIADQNLMSKISTEGRKKILDSYSQRIIAEKEALIHDSLLKGSSCLN